MLLLIAFGVDGAILSIVLSISLLSCLAALSSVVLSRIGMLLNSFLNCEIASSVNFCKVLFSSFDLGFVCRVSSVMNLCSDMYDLAISDHWYVACVMIMSSVCPRLCVGKLTCCFRLKAVSMFSRVCAP